MIKLNVIGQIFGTSGYASHTKGLVNALGKICDIKLSCPLFPEWEKQVNDFELSAINKPDDRERINLIIDVPFNWSNHLQKKYNIGFLVFEGDKIPSSWYFNISDKRISQVWVPSSHTYEAVRNTLKDFPDWQNLKHKIKIVPHGFNKEVFFPKKIELHPFTFLANKGFRHEYDRGGLQYLVKAFIEEFKRGEAVLVLKLNMAYANPQILHDLIMRYWKESGRTDEVPEIKVIFDNLTTNQLNDLYNSCDVFVSSTRCEAFGLPCLEAMACGKPVIATQFGGQTDYITNANGWLIPYKLEENKHEIIYEGVNWATPDLDILKLCMRDVFSNREQVKEKGVLALGTANDFTWDNSALKAEEALKLLNF